ncbi:MAG TPA: extracellular solute-binding protein [Symbiobacteriaceae bacterium]|nr:extracellular solute-binding protein [Symbiobacteriaceae bacterium]
MLRAYVAAILAGVFLLAGCDTPSPSSRVAPPPAEVITLKVGTYGFQDHDRMLDVLIAGFQAAHPQYRVEKVPVGMERGNVDRMKSLAARGELDLLLSDYDMRPYLRPLDAWLAKSRLDTAPLGSMLDAERADGRVVALPFSFQPMLLVYNTELVKAAGVSIPPEQWTWDEFRETARKLTVVSGDQPLLGVHADLPDWLPRAWIEARTGQPAWASDPKVIEAALQFFSTMVHTDKSLTKAQPGNFTEGRSEYNYDISPLTVLNQRKAAMSVESYVAPHALPDHVKVPWALAPMPSLPGKRPVIPGSTVSIGMPANSPHPDDAWEFLQYAAGPEGASTLAASGYLPAYRTDKVKAAWAAGPGGRLPGTEPVWNGDWQEYADPFRADGRFTDPFMRLVNRTLSGTMPLDAAMAEFLQRISRVH